MVSALANPLRSKFSSKPSLFLLFDGIRSQLEDDEPWPESGEPDELTNLRPEIFFPAFHSAISKAIEQLGGCVLSKLGTIFPKVFKVLLCLSNLI